MWLSDVNVPIEYQTPLNIRMTDEERYLQEEGLEGWEILRFKDTTTLKESDFSANDPYYMYYTYIQIENPKEETVSIEFEVKEPDNFDDQMEFMVFSGIIDPGMGDETSADQSGSGEITYEVEVEEVEQFTLVSVLSEDAPDDGQHIEWQFDQDGVLLADVEQPITYKDKILETLTKEVDENEVDEDSAVLRGEVRYLRRYTDVEVFFRYRELNGEWSETDKIDLPQDREFEEDLEGLTENTAYEYKAVSVANDREYIGNLISFITLDMEDLNGEGTEGDPYIISNWYELQAIWNDLDAYYELENDINEKSEGHEELIDTDDGWLPIGDASNPFTGHFDGQGKSISDLSIGRPDENNVGLFGHVGDEEDETTIRDVCIRDADITGGRGVGTLIGRVTGNENTLIERCCSVSSSVEGTGAVGGLIGSFNSWRETPGGVDNPVLEESFADVEVSDSEGGSDKFGGLVGCTQKGTILNSYALGKVEVLTENAERIGGLAGCVDRRGEIRKSYSASEVVVGEGAEKVGGLVGSIDGQGANVGRVLDSYWDTEVSGQEESAGGTGLTTNDMTGDDALENMDGFDFDNIWHLVEKDEDINGETPTEDGYPILRGLNIESQLIAQDIYNDT